MIEKSFLKNLRISAKVPNTEQYWELFNTTGWNQAYGFEKSELQRAIQNSWWITAVYDNDRLIGFGRVISDGIHHAFIVDLIVHPSYQNHGIGKYILKELINKCKSKSIRDIQLFAASDKYEFYQKLGFIKRDENAPGMQYVID